MAGRRVFFSFHYEADIWRASNLRNAGIVDASARAGWTDASLWEKVRRKGDPEIKRVIDAGLQGTSVTACQGLDQSLGAQDETVPHQDGREESQHQVSEVLGTVR
jgi:hypothetical protein